MRRTTRMLAWLGLAAGAPILFSGCGTAYDDLYAPLAGETEGTGNNPACSGDPSAKNITDECGVFVSIEGDVSGNGTSGKPWRTLEQAIKEAAAKGKRVYACNNGPYVEA